MSQKSSFACKVVFIVVLLTGFIILFGYPALTKYIESGVFIQISTEPKDRTMIQEIPAPAITFCASDTNSPVSKGWKNATADYIDIINVECGQPETIDEAVSCINNRTYSFEESIPMALRGVQVSKILTDKEFWNPDVTAMQAGKCQTLNYTEPVGSRLETNILWFNLNPELSYDVVIHDQKFYIYSLSPSAVPQIKIKKKPLKEARNFDLIYITMTKHIKINRPEFPCDNSEDYNFKKCVKESVAEKIGCRMEWDLDSDQSWPICTSMDQLRRYEQIYLLLSEVEQREVLLQTGCLMPCRYKEYKLVQNVEGFFVNYGLGVSYSTTEITVEEEQWVYPEVSFLAEFGGALGMFLGFSFMMIWDCFSSLLNIFETYKSPNTPKPQVAHLGDLSSSGFKEEDAL